MSEKKSENPLSPTPINAHGLLEERIHRYATLKGLENITAWLEADRSPPGQPIKIWGFCYQFSYLISLSKQLPEDKSAGKKIRDDFPRIQAYLQAIKDWDGRAESLLKKIPEFPENVEEAFSRIINYIWSLQHFDTAHTEISLQSKVIQYQQKHEYTLPLFCKNSDGLVDSLRKFPQIFPLAQQVQITLMPCYVKQGSPLNIESIGHRINVGRTSSGFLLEDSRAEKIFQQFSSEEYAKFLIAIFNAGKYQLHAGDYGLCILVRVVAPWQIKQDTPQISYPNPKDIWPNPQDFSAIDLLNLLFLAAYANERNYFHFFLDHLKEYGLLANQNKYTMLHFLVKHNNIEDLGLLLEKIAHILSIKTLPSQTKSQLLKALEGERSLILTACLHKHFKALPQLISFGYSSLVENRNGNTIFMQTATLGQVEALRTLARLQPDNLNYRSAKDGATTLHRLASYSTLDTQQLAAITELIALGADQMIPDNHGKLPFCYAAQNGNIEAMSFFLTKTTPAEAYLALNHRDRFGFTPITHAIFNRQIRALEFLLPRADLYLSYQLRAAKKLNLLDLAKIYEFDEALPLLQKYFEESSMTIASASSKPKADSKINSSPPRPLSPGRNSMFAVESQPPSSTSKESVTLSAFQ